MKKSGSHFKPRRKPTVRYKQFVILTSILMLIGLIGSYYGLAIHSSEQQVTSPRGDISFLNDSTGQKIGVSTANNLPTITVGEDTCGSTREDGSPMYIDPAIKIDSQVASRLQDQGITAVNVNVSIKYASEYSTACKSITVRSQVDATVDNLYHELGHHLWTNKLTSEEKTMFYNVKSRAYQEALGRPGYTEDDLVSEDFADFMRLALTGRIKYVPEKVRSIVQKYAQIVTY